MALQAVEARGGKAKALATRLRSEIPKWKKVIRKSGAKADPPSRFQW
jgi:hypothetical protein